MLMPSIPCDLRRSRYGRLPVALLFMLLLPLALARIAVLIAVTGAARVFPSSWSLWLLRAVLGTAGFRLRVMGLANLRETVGPTVVAFNHVCLWDPLLIAALNEGTMTVADPKRNASQVNELFFGALGRSFPVAYQILTTGRELVHFLRGWKSEEAPPPLFAAPEGTIGNGQGLFAFHPTFFGLGAQVVPLCVKAQPCLPISLHPIQGHHGMNLLWPLLLPWTKIEMEFLPALTIVKDESPRAFSNRVQQSMAKHLGVPATPFTREDKHLLREAMKIRRPSRARALVALDKKLLDAVAPPEANAEVAWARGVTNLGKTPTYLAISLGLMLYEPRRGAEALLLLLLTESTTQILKGVFRRPRPRPVAKVCATDWNGAYSFPSSHALNAAAFGSFMAGVVARPALGWLFLPAVLLVASSRLRLREHYPSDVAAGALLGVLISMLPERLVGRL
ncbi:MAG: phosphatase PAP2 family protein [Myxococcota bacterium]